MNILILSCGTRNNIVRYFKEALQGTGRVVAADMSPYAPALYEADGFYVVPNIRDPEYMDLVLEICRKEEISGVFSLIDPELSLLAANEAKFVEQGVTVLGSPYEQCERAMDKMEMYRWLKAHDYLCAESYDNAADFCAALESGAARFPAFVKPVRGSASMAIQKVCDLPMLDVMLSHGEDMMIQEYLPGQEIGADVYVDMISGEVVSIFTKKKLLMKAGETDKAVSFKDEALFALIRRFTKESGWRGQIDIDIFEHEGKYYISEVNPRFGGGYPHAHACGVDHVAMILRNLRGEKNEPNIGAYDEGVVMMKHSEIKVCQYE